MNRIDEIRTRLSVLAPEHLEIEDDSARHAGHAGAQSGGGHYNLVIVSAQFKGENTMRRHRRIYELLGDMMQKEIHALSIRAYSPDELS